MSIYIPPPGDDRPKQVTPADLAEQLRRGRRGKRGRRRGKGVGPTDTPTQPGGEAA